MSESLLFGSGGPSIRTATVRFAWCLLLLSVTAVGCLNTTNLLVGEKVPEDPLAEVTTIGDITEVGNVGPIVVSGVGLVTGLEGTGGGTPPGSLRTFLEGELRKRRVFNPKQLLDSPDNAMVIVTGIIPPGARKGDLIDVEVSLPDGSQVTSLRGGYLHLCELRNYDSTKHINPNTNAPDRMLMGHVIAKARGRLMVGLGQDGAIEPNVRHGQIWDGGVCLIDRPYFLTLNKDRKSAKVANAVAQRINLKFRDDERKRMELMRLREAYLLGEMTEQINNKFRSTALNDTMIAHPSKDLIAINVPWEYRLNAQRYLRVVRLLPLLEPQDDGMSYRKNLMKMLHDPNETIRVALRLEALGKESVPTLREGLQHEHPLVRFASAEALSYLGDATGVPHLAELAKEHKALRAYCLTALASLEAPSCRTELVKLLNSADPEMRYGAFRALQIIGDEGNPMLRGELMNGSFWVHQIAHESPPLVHFALVRRPEIVLFGREQVFVPPFRFMSGEFTVIAEAEDNRCTVSRFPRTTGQPIRRQCSLQVADVLRTLASLGAEYPEAVDLLRQVRDQKCLTCAVELNAIPQPTPVEELARAANDPMFHVSPNASLANEKSSRQQNPVLPTSYEDVR